MIRRLYEALPGNRTTRTALLFVIGLMVVVALFFFYEWLGGALDSGGTVG